MFFIVALHSKELQRTQSIIILWDMEPQLSASIRLGIPKLLPVSVENVPTNLISFRQRCNPETQSDTAVHFFLDDARFESVWNRPKQALTKLAQFPIVLTPDFSLYRNMPIAQQIWNTYRNRWCGAFWQQHGLTVIPTVSWSSAESFAFCFQGIPKRSVIAVSTIGVGLDEPLNRYLFASGFHAMVEQLEPSKVLCYGHLPDECRHSAEIREYDSRWDKIRNPEPAEEGR